VMVRSTANLSGRRCASNYANNRWTPHPHWPLQCWAAVHPGLQEYGLHRHGRKFLPCLLSSLSSWLMEVQKMVIQKKYLAGSAAMSGMMWLTPELLSVRGGNVYSTMLTNKYHIFIDLSSAGRIQVYYRNMAYADLVEREGSFLLLAQ